VIVADSEKENIGHQSLRNRQTAGQAKANLVLATEQSAVNIAHLEAKVSEGVHSCDESLRAVLWPVTLRVQLLPMKSTPRCC
jgi:hypothetical protein